MNTLFLTWSYLMKTYKFLSIIQIVDCTIAYGELVPFACQHEVNLRTVQPKQRNPETISPNFGFIPRLRTQHTLDNTTQFTRLGTRLTLRKHFKCRSPAARVSFMNAVVATDNYFSDTLALANGTIRRGGT
jgi:hypothetical protein